MRGEKEKKTQKCKQLYRLNIAMAAALIYSNAAVVATMRARKGPQAWHKTYLNPKQQNRIVHTLDWAKELFLFAIQFTSPEKRAAQHTREHNILEFQIDFRSMTSGRRWWWWGSWRARDSIPCAHQITFETKKRAARALLLSSRINSRAQFCTHFVDQFQVAQMLALGRQQAAAEEAIEEANY